MSFFFLSFLGLVVASMVISCTNCAQGILPGVVTAGVLSEISQSGVLHSVFAVPSLDDHDCHRQQNRIPLPNWGPCKSKFLADQGLGQCVLLNFSTPGNYTLCSPDNTMDGFQMDAVEVVVGPAVIETSFTVFFVDQPDTYSQIFFLHVGLTKWEVAWSPYGGPCESPSLEFHNVDTLSSSLVFIGAIPVPAGIAPGSVWAFCAREYPGSPAISVFQDPGVFYGFPPIRPKAILALGGITGISASGGNLSMAGDQRTVVGDAGLMVDYMDANITFTGEGFCLEKFAEVCESLNMFLSFDGPKSPLLSRNIANFLSTGNSRPCSEGSCTLLLTYGSTPGRNPFSVLQVFDAEWGWPEPRLSKWGVAPQVFGDGKYAMDMRGCADISGNTVTMYPDPTAGDRYVWMPVSFDGPYLNQTQIGSCVMGGLAPQSHPVSFVSGRQAVLNDTGLSSGAYSFCYYYAETQSWGLGLICIKVKSGI